MDTYLEFAANHTLLVTALLFSLFLLLFTELRRKAQAVTNVEPQDAVKLINSDAIVLDLRSSESFARGHIVNAKNVPADELTANQDKYSKNKVEEVTEKHKRWIEISEIKEKKIEAKRKLSGRRRGLARAGLRQARDAHSLRRG